MSLNMSQNRLPLVNKEDYNIAEQRALPSGFYVRTHSSTQDKAKKLEEISTRLGLNLQVEVVQT